MKPVVPFTACPAPAFSGASLPESSRFHRYRDKLLRIIANGPEDLFGSDPKSAAIQLLPHSAQQDLRGKWLRQTFLLITFLQSHLLRIAGDQQNIESRVLLPKFRRQHPSTLSRQNHIR